MIVRVCLIMTLCLATLSAHAGEPVKLETTMEKISYSSGHRLGEYYRKQHLPVRTDMVMQGLQDALQNARPAIPKGEMRALLLDPKKALADERDAQREAYQGEGRAFLEANAKKDGVLVLPSGLQYLVLQSGEGKTPAPDDRVAIRFQAKRLDGVQFDSSPADGSPVEMALDKMIPGIVEALKMMREGDKWRLFIPADLAFGERGPLADQTVIYDLELVKILN